MRDRVIALPPPQPPPVLFPPDLLHPQKSSTGVQHDVRVSDQGQLFSLPSNFVDVSRPPVVAYMAPCTGVDTRRTASSPSVRVAPVIDISTALSVPVVSFGSGSSSGPEWPRCGVGGQQDASAGVLLSIETLASLRGDAPAHLSSPSDLLARVSDPSFLAALAVEFAPPVFSFKPGVNVRQFDPKAIAEADAEVRRIGLLSTLRNHIQLLTDAAPSLVSVKEKFSMLDKKALDRLVLMHSMGAPRITKPGWSPNGGRGFHQSNFVGEVRRVVEHKLQSYMDEGTMFACSASSLSKDDRERLHKSNMKLVEKQTDESGRLCLAPTNGSAKRPSLNEGVDIVQHDIEFPFERPPGVGDICERLCVLRARGNGEPLCGATADVHSAYQQVRASAEKSILLCSQIGDILVFHLTCIFGETRASHCYEVFRVAIDAAHNFGQPYRRSDTYADDGILANVASRIQSDVDDYESIVSSLFGCDGIDKAKTKLFHQRLVAIGWDFNLDPAVWRVVPKDRSQRKMAFALFVRIPPGTVSVLPKTLESVISLLTWHSQVLRQGRSFLYTLFNDLAHARPDPSIPGNILLGCGACADLDVWRGLVAIMLFDHHFCGMSITVGRSSPTPTIFMRTDAAISSHDGGVGGFIARSRNGKAILSFAVTWTVAELVVLRRLKVSINTLEALGGVYGLIVAAAVLSGTESSLRDAVIDAEFDNTAAVSYLLKQRANSNSAAHVLVRLLSLASFRQGWSLLPHWLKGTLNARADRLSRVTVPIDFSSPDCLRLFQEDPLAEPSFVEDLQKVGTSSRILRIEAFCRDLLWRCLVTPASMPSQRILGDLQRLDLLAGGDSVV